MADLPITMFDLIAVGVLLISGLFGFLRGLTKEVLSVAGWIGAAVAAYFLRHIPRPWIEPYIVDQLLLDVACMALVFIVAVILISLATSLIASGVRSFKAIGSIDRSLGFMFGILRGVLVMVVAWNLVDYWRPGNPPEMVRDAASLPMIRQASDIVVRMLPEGWQRKTERALDSATGTARDAAEREAARRLTAPRQSNSAEDANGEKGYKPRDRNAIERIIPKD